MNANELASRVRRVLDAGLGSVRAEACVQRALCDDRVATWFEELGNTPLDVIAVGKAAQPMTLAFLTLPQQLSTPSRVLVVAPRSETPPEAAETILDSLRSVVVETLDSEHPLPGSCGERASARVEKWVEGGVGRDLVFLLSGGSSSMLPAPAEGFVLGDKVAWSDRLMRAGADIRQLNTVRTQMSRSKGGRLAARSRYERVLVLVISDVVGDDLSIVGSGPWHTSAASGAKAAVVVRSLLGDGDGDAVEAFARQLETTVDPPFKNDPCFERVRHVVCGSGSIALDAMKACATAEAVPLLGDWGATVAGEAREVATRFVESVLQNPLPRTPGLWIGSGETTVTVRGEGVGGRNQELALAFALEWERQMGASGARRFAFASLGTDGRDGPTPAAGALVHGDTLAAMRADGVDPAAALARNDSHRALASVGATLTPGPTGTNVGDLMVCAVDS